MKMGFWRGVFTLPTNYDAPDGGGGGGQQQQQQQGGGDRGAGDRGGAGDRNGDRGNTRGNERGDRGDGQQRQEQRADGTPFRLAPDALVETEDGRRITFKEYQSELGGTLDKGYRDKYKSAYDLLVKEAGRLDALSKQGQRGESRGADDPFAALDLENQPLVDGKMAAQLVKMLRDTGLNPIANLVSSLQKQVGQMAQQLKGTQSHIGTFNEERANHEFESNLTNIIKSTPIKGLEDRAIDPNNPALREFARNLYLSYQVDSWRPGEFQKMLGEQLSGVVAYMRTLDKDYAAGAQDRLRKHFAPQRGQGAGNGKQKFQFKSPRQIAAEARDMGMFGGSNRT